MLITTLMLAFLVFKVWRWNKLLATGTIALFALVDGIYFASNIAKIPDGGWFPLAVAGVLFTLLTTWATGRRIMRERMAEGDLTLAQFIASIAGSAHRVRNTAVYLSAASEGVPSALLHNLKHNQVLHARVLIVTVKVEEVPQVDPAARADVHDEGEGFFRVILRYGFMEDIDIPRDLAALETACGAFDPMTTSYFLGRQKLIPSADHPGMARWREGLFAWMSKSSESAMESFKLPTNRVVELGSQLQI
jgi:KUP system potassium uptake protein